jgi:hypothetical protein
MERDAILLKRNFRFVFLQLEHQSELQDVVVNITD